MSIYFDNEKKAWSLKDITEEESQLLLEMGNTRMLELIGASLLSRLQKAEKDGILDQINPEDMGHA